MEFLFSNYPPMKTDCKTFAETFYSLLYETSQLDIAVGYVSAESLVDLKKIIELNPNIQTLHLIIGMHYFERFTKLQYDAAMQLNRFLQDEKRGDVNLVNAFRFHGKLYSYSNEKGPFAGIIGSDNLSSISSGGIRVYESSLLIDDRNDACKMQQFIMMLKDKATKNIADLTIDKFDIENNLLDGHDLVKKLSSQERKNIIDICTDLCFEIPIKTEAKSNLNAYFGKGRKNKNGFVQPRHWYEAELIVSKKITTHPDYPKAKSDEAIFTVVTDDGWSFKCKVSGDYSKNLRSEGDLRILGKWLKGRMEIAGALEIGKPITEETLKKYGRSSFVLTKTTKPGVWYADFGVNS